MAMLCAIRLHITAAMHQRKQRRELIAGSAFSDRGQLYVGTGGTGQVKEVCRVAGEDVIAILSKADHTCVDCVRAAGPPEQQSGAPAEGGQWRAEGRH
jgi:hypothetical protein